MASGHGELIRALGYIGVGTSDLGAWAHFATDILGAEAAEGPGGLLLRLDDRPFRIAIEAGQPSDLLHAGWELADAEAFGHLRERLRAAGVAFEEATAEQMARRGVAGLILAADPNGIHLEFFHGMTSTAPYSSPRGDRGFLTGAEGLGHIVLTVDDFDRTMVFYTEILDLSVTDFIDFTIAGEPVTMAFLHCNARHHSLAFMVRTSAPRRLSHLMLEFLDLNDFGRTLDAVEREQQPVAMSLGRHTNDEVLSEYIVSPSGFLIEIGWGGRKVERAGWRVTRYDSPSSWGHQRRLNQFAVKEAVAR